MENYNIFFNPGIEDFQISLNSIAYIDKTELILHINKLLNTKKRYICVSGPRGFGKTTIVNMLTAYYSHSKDSINIFDNEKISKNKNWNRYLGQFNVIKINIANFINKNIYIEDMIDTIYEALINEIRESIPKLRSFIKENKSFYKIYQKIYNQTQRKIVLIIDEWDCILILKRKDKEFQKKYIDFLNNFIERKEYIVLTYITGILPIKKYNNTSSLDIFDDYSMLSPSFMSEFIGFPENEVKNICNEYKLNFDLVKEYYNGYHLKQQYHEIGDNGTIIEKNQCVNIFNSFSVINAIINKEVKNYWNKTKEYNIVKQYIQRNFNDLKEYIEVLLNGDRIKISIINYRNDLFTLENKNDIIIFLINLGYVGYDIETEEVYIPNKEMYDIFKSIINTKLFKHFEQSKKLLEATWNLDSDTVAELIEEAYNNFSNKQNHYENSLTSSIMNAYQIAKEYYTILHVDDGRRFDDIVFLPAPDHHEKPILLFELKEEDENLNTVNDKIKFQNYPRNFEDHYDKMLFIRITYNKNKHISCTIEKYIKK
ncbi:hypothetical protein PIROE2DRAFT_3759 [Piromyces sp. E2]|nr:hypothetical protein PIROE2DRAFT_3759 [Piromyces sp. E2]|eukprot:OUM68470.1 hypothetical protein PIROE2DRAFT_3759 [Piromyces sp. E2]